MNSFPQFCASFRKNKQKVARSVNLMRYNNLDIQYQVFTKVLYVKSQIFMGGVGFPIIDGKWQKRLKN